MSILGIILDWPGSIPFLTLGGSHQVRSSTIQRTSGEKYKPGEKAWKVEWSHGETERPKSHQTAHVESNYLRGHSPTVGTNHPVKSFLSS